MVRSLFHLHGLRLWLVLGHVVEDRSYIRIAFHGAMPKLKGNSRILTSVPIAIKIGRASCRERVYVLV